VIELSRIQWEEEGSLYSGGILMGIIKQIISFIEDREVIQTIPKHLGLWLVKSSPSPKVHAPPLLNDSECFYP
jgi:hypothetical protein